MSTPFEDEKDLCVIAKHAYIVAFDNLSKISAENSDALCRLVDGVGIKTRKLFTNGDLYILSAARPAIMTGISLEAWKSDLASRTLQIRLEPFDDDKARLTESELDEAFETIHAGALIDLMRSVSAGLRHAGEPVKNLPRLADFSAFCQHAEIDHPHYENGEFAIALSNCQMEAMDELVDNSLVIKNLAVATREGFRGTISELWEKMPQLDLRAPKGYPETTNALRDFLRMNAPPLRAKGWKVEFKRGQERLWTIVPPAPKTIEQKIDAKLGGY